MQRLFSTFADGWPGVGLLLQRFLVATALLHGGVSYIRVVPQPAAIAPQMIGAMAGILLLVGLWTPLVGTLVAIVEMWIVFAHAGNTWTSVLLATLGATLAMIGPGAWSIDARLFGRKHIQAPER